MTEATIWKEILMITATVQILAKQKPALRGHQESTIDHSNSGNFSIVAILKIHPVM